jgi:hypothetical protein
LVLPIVLAQSPNDIAIRAAAEDDIREIVLRRQMTEWAHEGDKSQQEAKSESEKQIANDLNFAVFFISVEEKDPSESFLKRFSDIPRKVKPVSGSKIAEEVRRPVVDKENGRRAIIFYVDKIKWLGKSSAQVDAGYHCDGLCAVGITYKLKLSDGKWTIVSERMNWIS